MTRRRQEDRERSSDSQERVMDRKMDFRTIMKDIEFLGSSHMTWKQKKDLENRKVVSLGGKPQKKQRLPLSVARVVMKNQKEREQKMLQENEILSRFKFYSSSGPTKATERRRPEDMVLKATEGNFRNGVLDVKHLLKPSGSQVAEGAKQANGKGKMMKKKNKGGKKGHGKRKGNGKKRH